MSAGMKVSIITVTRNSASTLARTMESVMRQTYGDIEYWIIDGNSTDKTVDIIKSYEQSFCGRLHWISEKDAGIYDAMNKGVARSTGDVIGFLNSDDCFSADNAVEKIVNAFADDNIDAVYGDIHVERFAAPGRTIYRQSGRIFRPFLLQFGFAPPHPAFYVRTQTLKRCRAFDASYRIAGDFELIARLFHRYKIKARYIPMDFVTMSIGGTSTKDKNAYHEGLDEILTACKRLSIKTNRLMLSLKKLFLIIANRV